VRKLKVLIPVLAMLVSILALAAPAGAAAPTDYFEGFEATGSTDAPGWYDFDDYGDYGVIDRVPSGTDGIVSSSGAFHATVSPAPGTGFNPGFGPCNVSGGPECYVGPFSRFDGYSDTFPAEGWVAELDVYLDPSWASGTGFDVSVAASTSAGGHLRDFIFHVMLIDDGGSNDGKLLVNGSNNSDSTPNPYKLQNENGGSFYEVTSAGWYTLQWSFRDAGGYLAVDYNLIDASDSVAWTVTRGNVLDTIPAVVGGNRYMWFTGLSPASTFAVDNQALCVGGCTTLLEDKQAALDLLNGIYPTGDKDTDKRFEKAIGSIGKSVTPEYWIDDTTLDPKDGKKVFDEEKKAVKELMKLEGNALADQVIDALVAIDGALAQAAVDAATLAGGDQNDLDKANERLAKAADAIADGDYDKAIEEYKKAWEYAQKAVS
jgi:hypothetical protein